MRTINIQSIVNTLNKRKPTHDNFQKIDAHLSSLGFYRKESFYNSQNGTTSGNVDNGGIWVDNSGTKIKTNYIIDYGPYNPISLSVQIVE